jgi:hypothetical protein
MKLIDPKRLPGDAVFVGSTRSQGGDQRLTCDTCQGPCWISHKNAKRKATFRCSDCVITPDLDLENVYTTLADVTEYSQSRGDKRSLDDILEMLGMEVRREIHRKTKQ